MTVSVSTSTQVETKGFKTLTLQPTADASVAEEKEATFVDPYNYVVRATDSCHP